MHCTVQNLGFRDEGLVRVKGFGIGFQLGPRVYGAEEVWCDLNVSPRHQPALLAPTDLREGDAARLLPDALQEGVRARGRHLPTDRVSVAGNPQHEITGSRANHSSLASGNLLQLAIAGKWLVVFGPLL